MGISFLFQIKGFFKKICIVIQRPGPHALLGIFFVLAGCVVEPKTKVILNKSTQNVIPAVTINQAITETVGTCSFTAASDPSTTPGFAYRIQFSDEIDTSSFSTADIVNAGTGGGATLTWSLINCGDDKNFKLVASAVIGNGTIIPQLAAGVVQHFSGSNISASSSTDNSILFAEAGWYQEAYLKAVNTDIYDSFGSRVEISGDTVAVSSYYESSNQNIITNGNTASADNSSSSSGAVYVYKRTGNLWEQQAYIKASNNDPNDYFGYAISLDGDTLAVGAIYEDSIQTTITSGASASLDNSAFSSGAVYVYKRTGANWAQEAYIKASNSEYNDQFGTAVSVHGDTLAVNDANEDSDLFTITNAASVDLAKDNNANTNSGAVFIYRRTGATWEQEAYIKASNNKQASSYYGASVSISGDSLAVGSFNEDSAQSTITNGEGTSWDKTSVNSGAAFVYKRTGKTWVQEAYIKASNNGSYDYFGYGVSLSGDTLAVSAPWECSSQNFITNGTTASADDSSSNSGSVYVYKRTGVTWDQEAYIKAVNSESGDEFGSGISLMGDTLVVGAYSESSIQRTITNGASAPVENDSYGSGAVYVYKRSANTWAQEAYIKAANNDPYDEFGHYVGISGDTIIAGAEYEESNQSTITNGATASLDNSVSSAGAVYIYRNSGRLFQPSDLYASATTTTSITLSWGRAGQLAVGYKIAYTIGMNPPADCNSGTVINVGNVLNYSFSSLLASSYYSFRICSYDSSNNLSEGFTSTFATTFPKPPDPGVLSVAGQSSTTIVLQWTSGKVTTSGFKLAYLPGLSAPIDCASGVVIDVGNVKDYEVTELSPSTDYSFRICSYDPTGSFSVGSSTVTGQTNAPVGWEQEAYIKASNNGPNDWFGINVSMSGDTVVVGSQDEDSSLTTVTNGPSHPVYDNLDNSGAVYVYKRNGKNWSQEAYIKASNAGSSDEFGFKVSVSGDTLAVSTCYEDSNQTTITNGTTAAPTNNSSANSGAVYVYSRTGNTWAQAAYIKAANNGSNDWFGYSLSVNGDTIAVGAIKEDSNQTTITNGTTASGINANTDSGAVYVYKRTSGTWAQEAYVKAANNGTNDYFGRSVSINGDSLAVGAIQEDSNQTTVTNGATAAADNLSTDSGAVYVYKRNGSIWAQEAFIKAANNGPLDSFGYSVSISGDSLAVGAIDEDSNQNTITNGTTASADNSITASGAVYVYKRTGVNWNQEAYIKASNNISKTYVYFGESVSISGDTLAVGAPGENSDQSSITNGTTSSTVAGTNYGAVYVYKRTAGAWAQEAYIKSVNGATSLGAIGRTLSVSGDSIAVGSNYEASFQSTITNGTRAASDALNAASGAVYIYRNSTRLFEISEAWATTTSSSITLRWLKSYGTAIGYYYSYQAGAVAPATCLAGTSVSAGDVATGTITGLSAATTYSYRICATSDGATFTEGVTGKVTTAP